MTLNDYQKSARKTSLMPEAYTLYYLLGLVGEAGECAGVYKKYLRGDTGDGKGRILVIHPDDQVTIERLKSELGDVLWYLSQTAGSLGYTLEQIAQHNLEKLADRQARGVLKGSGENR